MIENTIKVLRQIEKTHLNLGLPTVFAKLIDMSDLGLFLVAERGKGKTAVIDTIRDYLRHRDLMQVSVISYAGLERMANELDGKSITIINRDFSSFYTEYLRDVAVNLIATLITDKAVKADTGRYHIDFAVKEISFLSATQPQLLEKLNHIASWESMYRDRFIRFPMLYWFGQPHYIKKYPQVSPVNILADSIDTVSIPVDITNEQAYKRMVNVLQKQTSEGRCKQYVDKLLKAHAAFNERDIVLKADLDFIELFSGNLILDYLLSDRPRGVSNPLIFNADSYLIFFYIIMNGNASKARMREYFNVSNLTIGKNLNPLLAKNLVKGTYGGDKYTISKNWMERYGAPVKNWFKEAGIHN